MQNDSTEKSVLVTAKGTMRNGWDIKKVGMLVIKIRFPAPTVIATLPKSSIKQFQKKYKKQVDNQYFS